MADVKIIDIDSEQWNMKDQNARDRLTAIENTLYKKRSFTFGGTTSLSVEGFLIGEDNTYRYYQCYIIQQSKTIPSPMAYFLILPENTDKQKILSLNLNLLQGENTNIVQMTQHQLGANSSGIITYLQGQNTQQNWVIGGSLILREAK